MSKIHELPESSSRLLSSSQIITSVFCVVKELIENALDGEAKNIEVKLEDFGLDKIEVKDNGTGIYKDDVASVAKPHFTSKITSHIDLSKIQTYGFRGEALGAICAVADLVITTKTAADAIGMTYNFNSNGEVISCRPFSCSTGTNVSVLNLFKNIPVRKQFYRLEKNKKDELRKIEDLLIAFGCIQNGVRFVLQHNKSLIWQKSAVNNSKDSLIQVLGNSVVDHLQHFSYVDEQTEWKLEVYLPKNDAPLICGHSSSSRCITAINKRPVQIKAIDKLLKEYYNKSMDCSKKPHYPVCYLSITVPSADVDVNIEPNKTSVMLQNLEPVLEKLTVILKKCYDIDPNDKNKSEVAAPVDSFSKGNLQVPSTTTSLEKPDSVSNKEKPASVSNKEKPDSVSNKENFQVSCKLNSLKRSDSDFTLHQSKITPSLKCSDPNNFPNKKKDCDNDALSLPLKKKVKTSNRFLSPPNDAYHHLNTLKAFFSEKSVENSTDALSNGDVRPKNIDFPAVTAHRENSCETENTIKKQNDSEQQPIAINRKRHLSDSCLSISYQKTNVLSSSSTVRKEDNWSRGLLSSGEHIQPVAVLKPKVITASENTGEKNLIIDNLDDKKMSSTTFSMDRKLTAFDIFCRRNRLEIAAQNPEFSNHQIAQILCEKWSSLAAEEKAMYKSLADKDYPKNVKKKEKLGKTISQNLSKEKSKLVSKSLPRKKKKKVEKDVQFNMQQMKNISTESGYQNPCALHLITVLSPGVWICFGESKLFVLNTFRLQETIIYHRLLDTFYLEMEPLIPPQHISINDIGDDLSETILSLSNKSSNIDGSLSDERLTANGFNLRLLTDENEISIEVIGITKNIAYYGLSDLKEILKLLKMKGLSVKLRDCRPGNVKFYLQGEAVRIARQSPVLYRLEAVEDLFEQRKLLPTDYEVCLHHKPFIHELHHFNENEKSLVSTNENRISLG